MSLILQSSTALSSAAVSEDVLRDADELLRCWGKHALARAKELWRQEDSGLLATGRVGHWWFVKRELDHRLDRDGVLVAA